MRVILSEYIESHILKHFYSLDNEYLTLMGDKEYVQRQLIMPTSKFFESFASNPRTLLKKINDKLKNQEITDGKHELVLHFNEIVGFDLLLQQNELSGMYRTTRYLNLIVHSDHEKINIITVFPGTYAPPLPQTARTERERENAVRFWETHKMSNFNAFEKTEKQIIELNKQNDEIWRNRFLRNDETEKTIAKIKNESKKINYQEGINLSEFLVISNNLLSVGADEDTMHKLNTLRHYFETTGNLLTQVRIMLEMASQYDLLGLYEKGIDTCLQAVKIAEDNDFKTELSDLYSAYGFLNIRISDYNQAAVFFEKSLKIREQQGNVPAVAASYNQLARINFFNKNIKKAEQYYLKSIEIRKQNDFQEALIWSYIGLAGVYIEVKDYHKALDLYDEIEYIKQTYRITDAKSSIMTFLGKGQIYNNLQKYEEAKPVLIKALREAEKIKIKPLLYQVCYELYKSYRNLNDNDKALQFYEQYHNIKESVLNEENVNKLKHQQIAFAIEQSEKEKEIERLKNVELKKANDEITRQKERVEEIHNELKDSINYAQRIQQAVLPASITIKQYISDFFIYFKPKDIVSGDFYWWTHVGNHTIITAADSTGHGVPGAFMSMLGISFLREIVNRHKIVNTGRIVDKLRNEIIVALKQKGIEGEQKDGMDIAIISIDHETNMVQFSGANNPLYVITNDELQMTNEKIVLFNNLEIENQTGKLLYEVKPDKMPIAIYDKMDPFTTHEFQLKKGDMLYMFSDGFADQFGGKKGKKFKYKPFKRLLLENADKPMEEQKSILEKTFEEWKGGLEQIDDVVVVGIKI
jgi:serine phosphatase RsbU (regulator of sigma subunit)